MTYVFLDTETTGLNPDLHEVWEIAYAVDDGPIKHGFVTHNAVGADPAALNLNGYFDRFLGDDFYHDALRFEFEARRALHNATIIASNPSFDTAFLRRRWGYEPWYHRKIDISTFALPIYGEMLGLYKIAERLKIEPPDHTAAQDVDTLRRCFRALQAKYGQVFA